jgi:hypothetical protein
MAQSVAVCSSSSSSSSWSSGAAFEDFSVWLLHVSGTMYVDLWQCHCSCCCCCCCFAHHLLLLAMQYLLALGTHFNAAAAAAVAAAAAAAASHVTSLPSICCSSSAAFNCTTVYVYCMLFVQGFKQQMLVMLLHTVHAAASYLSQHMLLQQSRIQLHHLPVSSTEGLHHHSSSSSNCRQHLQQYLNP